MLKAPQELKALTYAVVQGTRYSATDDALQVAWFVFKNDADIFAEAMTARYPHIHWAVIDVGEE